VKASTIMIAFQQRTPPPTQASEFLRQPVIHRYRQDAVVVAIEAAEGPGANEKISSFACVAGMRC
jgi:hypothetical protein